MTDNKDIVSSDARAWLSSATLMIFDMTKNENNPKNGDKFK